MKRSLISLCAVLLVGLGAWQWVSVEPANEVGSNDEEQFGAQAEGVSLSEVDGGADYYGRWPSSLPTTPDFFPVAVWLQTVDDPSKVARDRDVGLNTYLGLTTPSRLSIVRDGGMRVISSNAGGVGRETVGWLLADEVDMWAGAGEGTWTGRWPGQGDICAPSESSCGYTVQEKVSAAFPSGDGRLRYGNYGKGVTFWLGDTASSRFANEFQDVVSATNYWFTDGNICRRSEGGVLVAAGTRDLTPDECHRASNYGRTVDRMRALTGGGEPVWAFVETGHPFKEKRWPTIQPDQVAAAAWSAIIHGARGIVYFNHSFGGAYPSQDVLNDPNYAGVREAVKATNQRIAALAPVLNAPFADGLVSSTDGIDVIAKYYQGKYYVLAGARTDGVGSATVSVRCGTAASVDVLDENRTVDMVQGAFTDDFPSANSVHIYRFSAEPGCEPRASATQDSQ